MPIPKVNEWNGMTRGYVCKNSEVPGIHRYAWFRIIPLFVPNTFAGDLYCVSDRERACYSSRISYPREDCPFPVITNEPKKALIKIGHGGRGTR